MRSADDPPQAKAPATFMTTVSDQLGRVVPNVPVTLSNTSTGQNTEGVTDQIGEFKAPDLPAGNYQVKVWKPGFKTASMGVQMVAGQTTRSPVTLQLGMLEETVVVSAQTGAAPIGTLAPQARHIGAAPTDDPCSQSAEGGCVTPPRKLVDAKPVYPAWLVGAGTSGTVVIQGRLRTDGSVGDMQPAPDANPGLADAAMQAIRLWEFSPARLNGVPMEVQIDVRVQFVAEKK